MPTRPYSPEILVFVFAASTLALMLIVKILGYFEQKERNKNKK